MTMTNEELVEGKEILEVYEECCDRNSNSRHTQESMALMEEYLWNYKADLLALAQEALELRAEVERLKGLISLSRDEALRATEHDSTDKLRAFHMTVCIKKLDEAMGDCNPPNCGEILAALLRFDDPEREKSE